jgi:hypothetical protein
MNNPKVLKDFPKFARRSKGKHDWDVILDGKIRQFTKKERHFTNANSFRSFAYFKANEKGIKISVSANQKQDVIVIGPRELK